MQTERFDLRPAFDASASLRVVLPMQLESDSLIQIPIQISMGVAELAPSGTLDTLTRDADAALYRAKNAGRNIVSA